MSATPSEGVIKFKYNLKWTAPLEESSYIKIEKWRTILFKMNFIGEYLTEQVGYGNLSCRQNQTGNSFIITGTQTGKHPNLDGSQYTKVQKCDLAKMSVDAIGPIAPSSESLTHFAIYKESPQINCVFHVHHPDLWRYMLDHDYDQTPENIDYGTHEMAAAAKICIGNKKKGIFVMAGHQDGIIAYASSAEEAGKVILDTLKESKTN